MGLPPSIQNKKYTIAMVIILLPLSNRMPAIMHDISKPNEVPIVLSLLIITGRNIYHSDYPCD